MPPIDPTAIMAPSPAEATETPLVELPELPDPPVLSEPAADDVIAAVEPLPPEPVPELVPPVDAEPGAPLVEAGAADELPPLEALVVAAPAVVEAGAEPEPGAAVATQEQTDEAAAWTERAVWTSLQALKTQLCARLAIDAGLLPEHWHAKSNSPHFTPAAAELMHGT